MSILKKRGQLVTNDDGSQTMVSYPQVSHNILQYIFNILIKVPIKFPNNLKKDLTDWSTKVGNMYLEKHQE